MKANSVESAVSADGDVGDGAARPSAREEGTARGRVVHALLEWSQHHGWDEPPAELVRAQAIAEGLEPEPALLDGLLAPLRAWLGASLLRDRVRAAERTRAELPLLLGVGGTVLRGSIDLLVESDGAPPLVVDYKTDALDGSTPGEHAARYDIQRAIYALATAEALGTPEVEVAYVFLDRPEEPVLTRLDEPEISAARDRLSAQIERIAAGEFPVAGPENRSWAVCRGCPALGRLCSGPSG